MGPMGGRMGPHITIILIMLIINITIYIYKTKLTRYLRDQGGVKYGKIHCKYNLTGYLGGLAFSFGPRRPIMAWPGLTGPTPWALVRAWPGILWGLARRYMDQIEALSEIYKIRWVPASRYSIKWSIMTKQCRTYEKNDKKIKKNDKHQTCRAFFSGHFWR